MTHNSLSFNVAAETLSESFEPHSFVNLVFFGNYQIVSKAQISFVGTLMIGQFSGQLYFSKVGFIIM